MVKAYPSTSTCDDDVLHFLIFLTSYLQDMLIYYIFRIEQIVL